MPLNITSASGKGQILGMAEWGDDDLIADLEQPALPRPSAVVNDWFWGGQAPDVTVIPWTWLRAPIALRADQPINSASITRVNQPAVTSNNTTSQTTYGLFAAATQIDTISVYDAANLAAFLTTYYANPLMRCPTITISLVPRTDEDRWRILGREIGDRFTLGPGTVQDAPGHTIVVPVPAALPLGAQSLVIEGIQHSSSIDDRTVEWTTAPLLGATKPGGLLLTSKAGDYASTPDAAPLDIAGDIDVRCDLNISSWVPLADSTLVAKYQNPSQRSFQFQVDAAGTLRLRWSMDGTNTASVASSVPVPNNAGRLAVRAALQFTGGANFTMTFYTAPSLAGPWTVLGSPTSTTTSQTAIFSSTSALEVGSHNLGLTQPLAALVYAVELRNGVDGTIVANPNFAAQTAGMTSFTDGVGRVWTVNGTAQIVTSAVTPGPWFRLGQSQLDGTDAMPF